MLGEAIYNISTIFFIFVLLYRGNLGRIFVRSIFG